MFKKLRERIYNKKMIDELRGINFDSFTYSGYNEYPMFIKRPTEHSDFVSFVPQTDETFHYAFTRLKNEFFDSCDEDEIKNRIRVYMSYFKISEQAYAECMNIVANSSNINANIETKQSNI